MKIIKTIGLVFLIVLFACFLAKIITVFPGKGKFKRYVIENSHRVYRIDDTWRLKCTNYYWEEITIKKEGNNGYYLIAWGRRDKNLFWYLFLDYDFTVDIPYNRSKNNSVGLDEEIIRIMNSI